MTTRKSLPPGLIPALLVFFLLVATGAVVVYLQFKDTSATDQNPYEYDIEPFRAVDPGLLKYRESATIPIAAKPPHGLAVDTADRIHVTAGTALLAYSPEGEELSRTALEEPALCLAVHRDGRRFLGMADHVEVYAGDGRREARWTSLGEDALITSIAVSDTDVFVADYGYRLVWQFGLDGSLRRRLGEHPDEDFDTGFIVPSPYFDVTVAADHTPWIVNPGRTRVEHYSREGVMLSRWGEGGMEIERFCGCCNPSHLAIGPDGNFFTSEKGMPRVKVYAQDGSLRAVVAAPAHFAPDAVGLDLAVDSKGRVLVLDPKAGVVRIFVAGRPNP